MTRRRQFAFVKCLSLSLFCFSAVSIAARTPASSTAAMPPRPGSASPDTTVSKNDQTRTIDCAGGSVTVSGDRNSLTLTGECSLLRVEGNSNVIGVDLVADIATLGNRNKITWKRGPGGKPPKISNPGTGNTIKKSE